MMKKRIKWTEDYDGTCYILTAKSDKGLYQLAYTSQGAKLRHKDFEEDEWSDWDYDWYDVIVKNRKCLETSTIKKKIREHISNS